MSNLATIPNGFVSNKTLFNVKHVIDLVTSNPYFQLTKIEKDDYSLSNILMIRITKTGNGYLAIRHNNYDVQYS